MGVGEATSGVVAAVTVMFAVEVTSLVPPALNVIVDVLAPEAAPAHPAAMLTEYIRPAAELAAVNVVLLGAVIATPPVGAAKVTTMVFDPVRAVTGFMVTETAVPGPVAVLQVKTIGVAGVTVSKFTACMLAAEVINANVSRDARERVSAICFAEVRRELTTMEFITDFPPQGLWANWPLRQVVSNGRKLSYRSAN